MATHEPTHDQNRARITGTLTLSKTHARALFVYFALILFISLLITGIVLSGEPNSDHHDSWTVIGALGMAGLGSSIYYIRKLYKALISDTMDLSDSLGSEMRRLGVLIYFASRPLFAFAFSLLLYALAKSGLSASIKGSYSTAPGFLYILMTFSFFAGFLSGKLIDQLEDFRFSVLPTLQKGKKDAAGP